ncbi:MAG: VWA domain-containing protein [Bryobacteraceae bacterium]|jgi:VWFA-related protein
MRSWSFFLLVAALAAQTQTSEVTTREVVPTFQSTVNLVRVPAVVRDKQGNPVGNLQKQDFHLTDRGKPQEVVQFAVEGSAVPKPAPPAAAQLEIPRESAGEGPKRVAPARFVAFVFDDVHLSLGDLTTVRAAAWKHIEPGIPPQERVALLTLSGKTSLEFTNDVAKFREALMKVMPVPPRVHFPPASFFVADWWVNRESENQNAAASQALTLQIGITNDCLNNPPNAAEIAKNSLHEAINEGRGDAINAFHILGNAVRLLGAMPGERVMILASPGMHLPSELQKDLDESIERATHLGVVINTLDARGVYTVEAGAEVQGCHTTTPQTQELLARFNHDEVRSQGMILGDLAYGTGGTALAQNDFVAEFDRLSNPPEYVYYLGFYPRDLKPDGKYHEIKVTLPNGKGLSVEARKGYWAPSHLEDAAATATREVGESVFSHDEVRDFPIDIHTQFYKTSPEEARVKVAAHFDIAQLPLRKQDERNRDDLTLVCALFDANGNYIKGTQKMVELRLKDENLERRRKAGITVNSELDVKSGPYMIRVVVRDAEGHLMAAANGAVEIP